VFDAEYERLAEIVVDVAQGATVAASSSPRHGAVRNGATRVAAVRKSASHAGRSRISNVARVAS
jgi:hypothetical protein